MPRDISPLSPRLPSSVASLSNRPVINIEAPPIEARQHDETGSGEVHRCWPNIVLTVKVNNPGLRNSDCDLDSAMAHKTHDRSAEQGAGLFIKNLRYLGNGG